MNFYNLSNLDIKMIYILNENDESESWMPNFFMKVKFFANCRVKKIKNFSEKEDMIQEAYIGLWEAIKTFDYQKNFDFYRWAQWHISKKIRDCLLENRKFRLAKSGINDVNINDDLEEIVCSKMTVSKILLEKDFGLTEREKKVMVDNLYYEKTLSEISSDLEMSIEGIRKIKIKGINKVKNRLLV